MDESTSRQMPPDGAKQVWYAQPPPYQPASYDNNFQQGQNAPPNYSGQPPVQPAWGSQQPQQYQPPPNQQHAMYSGGPPPPSFHPQPPPQMNQQVVIMGSTGYPRVHHECVQSFAGQIAYSCFVAWCCNCLFGIIAFILASECCYEYSSVIDSSSNDFRFVGVSVVWTARKSSHCY